MASDGGTWRYMAQRFDGTGFLGEFVDLNLPLRDVEVEETLSGHNSLSATISPALARLKGSDGRPIFDEWGVAIWAESPTGEIFGGLLESSGLDGSEWALECIDLSGALIDCPFDDAVGFENVDPIDVFRYLWGWFQATPGRNLGVVSDMTASPVRLGTEMTQVQDFDQEAIEDPTPVGPSSYANNAEWVDKAVKKLFKLPNGWTKVQIRNALEAWLASTPGDPAWVTPLTERIVKKARKILGDPPNIPGGPDDSTPTVDNPAVYQVDSYKINWYTNHDISADIDDLAASTPFDWCMTHYWSDEGDEADLIHHIRIGYPKLGRRLTDLRFVLGENIHESPTVSRDGTEYASEVIVLGNGEGSAMLRGRAFRATPGRMRRTITITDQNLTTEWACNLRALEELAARTTLEELDEIILIEHPHAPVGSVRVGDEFLLEGKTDWMDMSVNVRCVGRRFSPDDSSVVTLTVIRTDRLDDGGGNGTTK